MNNIADVTTELSANLAQHIPDQLQAFLEYSGTVDNLPLAIVVSALVHNISISSVSILLHREGAHRSVKLHPAVKKVMEGVIRATSPIIPKEWIAAHKHHHAHSDKVGDPHSPHIPYPKDLNGFQLFLESYLNLDYSHYNGTIDTLYENGRISGTKPGKLERMGPMLALGSVYILLFGPLSTVIMGAIQASLGKGTVSGVNAAGHGASEKGGRTNDYSKNVVMAGNSIRSKVVNNVLLNFLCGGEHFHRNHHDKMQSADISLGNPEYFDLGFWYIKQLEKVGLASNIKT